MRPKAPERTERLEVIVSDEELAAIDEFRLENCMPNRTAAVRELLRRGVTTAKKERAPPSS